MPPGLTNIIGSKIKTLAGTAVTSADNLVKNAKSIVTSSNININGLKSAVEGIPSELEGAIASKLGSIKTVADSLISDPLGLDAFSHVFKTGAAPPPWPNVLEKYASFTYIWTLSCLTLDELNRPDSTYRLRGPKNIICRSGGSGSAKVLTANEAAGAVEFYIDDIEIDSVLTHNKGTKQADALGGSFKIFEPYSMGMFYETLQIAALTCGYKNYIDAPFMLSVHFKGWDDNGNISTASQATRYFPIHILQSSFNVTEQGSTYDVTYVKHDDLSFGDQTQAAKTDLNLTGNTVQEILQSGAKSLSTTLNTRLLKSKEAKQTNKVDQYIIMFPKERSSKNEAILGEPSETKTGATSSVPKEGDTKTLSPERKRELFTSISGLNNGTFPISFNKTIETLQGITIQRNEVSESIRTYAENPLNINEIGQSKIVKSANDKGVKPQVDANNCDAGQGVVCRAKTVEPTTTRSFQFTSGTKVQDIIEEILLSSDWGRDIKSRLNNPDPQNMVDWFKVESQVYEAADPKTVDATGQNPKTYVYRIVPFKVNASRFASVTKRTPGMKELKSHAAKEYNYIYTGKNKDVIDFDLAFNNAFYVGIGAQKGQNSKDSKIVGQGAKTTANTSESPNKLNAGSTDISSEGSATVIEEAKKLVTKTGGGGQEWTETQVARDFNSAILNSDADLLEVDLKIWGDPFWLGDSGVGNYSAEQTEYINMTKDGSVDYQSSEVDLVLNFRTPFDIGDNGWMEFGGISAPAKSFSGLYQCLQVKSSFMGGKFEQTLTLVRRRNQDEKAATENAAKKEKELDAFGGSGLKITPPDDTASSNTQKYIDGGPISKVDKNENSST